MRASVVDVRLAFGHYAEVLNNIGVDTSSLELQEGDSASNYRAFLGGYPAPGTTDAAFNGGYLGSTAREAVETLKTMIRALEFAHTHLVN